MSKNMRATPSSGAPTDTLSVERIGEIRAIAVRHNSGAGDGTWLSIVQLCDESIWLRTALDEARAQRDEARRELQREKDAVGRLAEWCVTYRDRLDLLIGTAGGSERTMIVATGMGNGDRVARVCSKPWPRGVFVQAGEPRTFSDGDVAPAFVEAFSPSIDEDWYRGEGATIEEAEVACWKRYARAASSGSDSPAESRRDDERAARIDRLVVQIVNDHLGRRTNPHCDCNICRINDELVASAGRVSGETGGTTPRDLPSLDEDGYCTRCEQFWQACHCDEARSTSTDSEGARS